MVAFLDALHWGAIGQIILIDILLGGDNAVIIALACRNLDPRRRLQGIVWGTAGAIVLRVVLIAFALALLDLPWLKLTGAVLLVWIGVRLMIPEVVTTKAVAAASTFWKAIGTIIVADLVMSLDNVLAIAGAANNTHLDHQLYYVIFGLVVSVPIIVWGSTLVLKLLDRFPLVITLGAGLLGWIAGGMLVGDTAVLQHLARLDGGAWVAATASGMPVAVAAVHYGAAAVGALLVVSLGWLLGRRRTLVKE